MSVLNLLRSDPEARTGERLSKRGEPTWEIAQFLPKQGEFAASQQPDSVLLPGFTADVAAEMRGGTSPSESVTGET